MYQSIKENTAYMNQKLLTDVNFDIISRKITIAEKECAYYCVDGFCKDALLQKLMQYFISIKKEDFPQKLSDFQMLIPYVEVDLKTDFPQIVQDILSGAFALFIDGYDECILIDSRTYPARNVDEPDKDKVLRGSKDGFVETLIFNTALIRRRIRSTDLHVEIMHAGHTSFTDIAVCYMNSRVNQHFLKEIKERIAKLDVDALTMNQESLAECLYPAKWFNPFPKFKYTERPDTAVAQILEGSIILLVDNSPYAMILPTSILDMIQEADDFYFPPITGSYLRISRFLILIVSYLLTPTFLLLCMHPEWIPSGFEFIQVRDTVNVPILWQFLILELALDGLRLASVNAPSMLSTPLSVTAGLILGEFAVESGWFNSEIMLYMAFVAIATYTHPSYELGYAFKFFRMLHLVLVSAFHLPGYVIGILLTLFAIISNKMISGQSYLYPLIPPTPSNLKKAIFRLRLKK